MNSNEISSVTQAYENKNTAGTKSNQGARAERTGRTENSTAAVYEKGEQAFDTNKTYTRDSVTIDRLKAEAKRRTQSFRELVQKLLLNQGETYTKATDIYALLREGRLQVDDKTRAQAQTDIAEDGYWGVEQTSDRIVEFAKALSGNDQSKADELIDAVKKGFEQATEAWGEELPEISQKTLDAAVSKLEAWRDKTPAK